MEEHKGPINVTRKRQYYDAAYKRNAVELAIREGHSVRAGGRGLQHQRRRVLPVAPGVWPRAEPRQQGRKDVGRSGGGKPATAPGVAAHARAGGCPKKITGHPLGKAHERFAQVEAMKGEYSVRGMCVLLGELTSIRRTYAKR